MLAAMHVLAEFGLRQDHFPPSRRVFRPMPEAGKSIRRCPTCPLRRNEFEKLSKVVERSSTLDGLARNRWVRLIGAALPPIAGEVRGFGGSTFAHPIPEPLLRLNVEGGTSELMACVRDEVLAIIRQELAQ